MFIAIIAFNRLLTNSVSVNRMCVFNKTRNCKENEHTLAEAENDPREPILSLFHSNRGRTVPTNPVFSSSMTTEI